jgi:uncharacterized protein (DUF2235 family)
LPADEKAGPVLRWNGDGVEANIYDAYRFLIGNYAPGDEIYRAVSQ